MIFSYDDSQVIATPSKCGSTALEHALKNTHYYISPRHRVDKWPGRRTLVIRNPLHRYYAAYWHLSQSKGAWCYECTGDEFVTKLREAHYEGPWIGAYTDHRMWTLTFIEMIESFDPHRICRLEDGLEKVAGVPVKQRWPSGDPRKSRANRRCIELSSDNFKWLLDHTFRDRREFQYYDVGTDLYVVS